jgi:argininosuccinate lyase
MDKTIDTVTIFAEMTKKIKFNKNTLEKVFADDDFVFATDVANHLVAKGSMSFREAHSKVGALVRYCYENKKTLKDLSGKELKSMLGTGVTESEMAVLTNPKESLSKRNAIGSPNPTLVKKSCAEAEQAIEQDKEKIKKISKTESTSIRNLIDKLSKY